MSQARTRRQLIQLGAALRRARIEAGLTQQQLGDLAGVSRQLVSRVEAGSPRGEIGRFAQIADALKMRLVIAPAEQKPTSSADQLAVQDLLGRIRQGLPPEPSGAEEHE
ncbi:helix-turn-helix domain-containing protein [Nocardia speluncae]|uniref:Helix-turn-helix domain-containing protein n=1 Tax=Nocardia speluncae TaxID=419477 RepID=A0A846XHS9_9NOCA|nr:helix-turn-helix domain-containing protein [Nocardia speluncae]NKY35047.1 helix-turn-helix domain-containing protein [Nocardia speluncae]